MKKIAFILLLIPVFSFAQINDTIRALFIGNSYTYYNNMPNLVFEIAKSMNDTLIHDSYTPGGKQLNQHAVDPNTQLKIKQGGWDRVVLQEQSQKPSFPDNQVASDVYPYAQQLNDTIKKYNPCSETVFYMTWGRENGDAGNCGGWPPVCTYEGMDDLLRERYEIMAADNDAEVAPVSVVWRYIRENYPTSSYPNLDLYSSDGSHPSLVGSYLAAVTFYTTFFKKDPTLVSFNSSLSSTDADIIKSVVKNLVYNDLLTWNIGKYIPVYDFTYSTSDNLEYQLFNQSTYAYEFLWNFDDGNTSTEENPIHTFSQNKTHNVTLTSNTCNKGNIASQDIIISTSEELGLKINELNSVLVYPNPSNGIFNIKSSLIIDSFELFSIDGKLIEKGAVINSKIVINKPNSGVYYLTVKGENNSKTVKITIE